MGSSSRGAGPVVDSVSTSVYRVPTDAPEGDGTLSWDSTTVIVAQVRSGGATGLGYTYGAAATAQVIDEQLAAVVTGRCTLDVPGANEAMSRTVRNAGRPGLVAGAISAVDIALWDLKARLLHMPLVGLLGAAGTEVPVYGSGGFTTYDDRQQDRQLRSWVAEQGIPRVKIKIGESWGAAEPRDRQRIALARRSIGDATELYVDANGGYTRKQAIRLGPHLDAHGVTWFEEPVSSDDTAGLAQVRAGVTAEVTAGEYGYTLPYFWHLLQAGAVDCLQADATRCGGLTVWLRAAALAEAAGLQDLRPLRTPCPRACGGVRPQSAAPGVVPRPRAHREPVLQRRSGPVRRDDPARRRPGARPRAHAARRPRRPLPHRLRTRRR